MKDSQIDLKIGANDVVTVKEHWQYLEERNTYPSIWSFIGSYFIHGTKYETYSNLRIINNLFDWKVTLENISYYNIHVHRIWLYDQGTGEKSCS